MFQITDKSQTEIQIFFCVGGSFFQKKSFALYSMVCKVPIHGFCLADPFSFSLSTGKDSFGIRVLFQILKSPPGTFQKG